MDKKLITSELKEKGYFSPVRIFNKNQCKAILKEISKADPPFEWHKGRAISSSLFFEISRSEKIIETVKSIIGENILLWGASIVRKKPGIFHVWHTDIETSSSIPGKTLSVWVGLKNSRKSSLKLISYSHTFEKSFQQTAYEKHVKRGMAQDQEVLKWAKKCDYKSQLVKTNLRDGEAIFFDGKLWHSSYNNNKLFNRTAILLQYTNPDTQIRRLNPENLDWPFKNQNEPKTPCILIKGKDEYKLNRTFESPPTDKKIKKMLSNKKFNLVNLIRTFEIPLAENNESGWQPYHIFRGSTKSLNHITNHVSVLSPGYSPHPPHTHNEEEILIMIEGEADIILGKDEKRFRLKSGQLSYYPSFYPHTIDNKSSMSATYMMFKWRNNRKLRNKKNLCESIFEYGSHIIRKNSNLNSYNRVFQSPTQFLTKLHCHTTVLKPGGGYEPHRDGYDVAIVLLKGQIETLGKKISPLSTVYYPKGKPHGIRNIGNTDAFYLVFEFHGQATFLSPLMVIRALKNKLKLLLI